MSKLIASYVVRVHLRAVEAGPVLEPPTLAEVEKVVRSSIEQYTEARAEISVKAERIDE